MTDTPARAGRWSGHRLSGPLAEGFFVLLGILGAFALQAWWEYRSDRVDEAARLLSVRSELLEARGGYEQHLDYLDRQDQLSAAILQEAESYSGSESRMDSLLFRLGPFDDFAPPMAAYDDAVAAGGLSLIRSAQVRQALARYGTAVRRDREEQDRVRDYFAQNISPLWAQYLNTRNQLATGRRLPDGYPSVSMRSHYEDLFQDQRFSNQIAARTIQTMRVRSRHQAVLEEIQGLIDLLQEGAR